MILSNLSSGQNSVKVLFFRWLLFFSSCMSWGGSLKASDSAEMKLPPLWNLNDCIQYANSHNYDVLRLQLNRNISEQNYLLARAALLPDLYGTGNLNLNHYGLTAPEEKIAATNSVGLNSSLSIYKGGFLKRDIQLKKLTIQSSGLSIEQEKDIIDLQITQSYLNVLLDKESEIYFEDLVKTTEFQLKQMQEKYDVGTAAKKDLLQLNALLAQDKYQLTLARNNESQDKLDLKQLLQLPYETSFDIQAPDTVFSLASISPLPEVQSIALNTRPEIKISELELASDKMSVEQAKSSYLPAVNLSAGTGRAFSNTKEAGFAFNNNNNSYQQASITASVPIFSRRVNKTNVEKAWINVRQSELALTNSKMILSQTVEKAYLDAVNRQSEYISSQEELESSKEAFRVSGEELRIGSANVVDYIQSRNSYVQALQQFVASKYKAAVALKIYGFYQNIPLSLD